MSVRPVHVGGGEKSIRHIVEGNTNFPAFACPRAWGSSPVPNWDFLGSEYVG